MFRYGTCTVCLLRKCDIQISWMRIAILRKKTFLMEAHSPDYADEIWMLRWLLLSFRLECKDLSSYVLQNKFVNCNLLH